MTEHRHEESTAARNRRAKQMTVKKADDGAGSHLGNRAASRPLQPHDAGVPLPLDIRAQMQMRLGAELGDVRVHADAEANRAAESVDAVAYTTAEHIVLGPTAPALHTATGNAVLAHELAHVVQQRRASIVVDGVSSPTDAAEAAANSVAHGAGVVPAVGAVAAVQRQTQAPPDKQPLEKEVTREEAKGVLSGYVRELLHKQGSSTVKITPEWIDALGTLYGNPTTALYVAESVKGFSNPDQVARYVAGKLPARFPESRIAKVRGKPTVVTPVDQPKTFTDATLGRFVDLVVSPIIKGLPKDQQEKVLRAVKDAAAAGSVAALKAGLDKAGLSGPTLEGVTSAFENALTKEPGATTDRQAEGAGSPHRNDAPPSIAPPATKVEGEESKSSPSVPFQEPGVKPPATPEAPGVRVDLAAERVARSVDPNRLVPPGTPENRISVYPRGPEWALQAARRLEEGQSNKDQQVSIELGAVYADVAIDSVVVRAEHIVLKLSEALPHRAALVRSVTLTVNGRPVRSFPLHPSN